MIIIIYRAAFSVILQPGDVEVKLIVSLAKFLCDIEIKALVIYALETIFKFLLLKCK